MFYITMVRTYLPQASLHIPSSFMTRRLSGNCLFRAFSDLCKIQEYHHSPSWWASLVLRFPPSFLSLAVRKSRESLVYKSQVPWCKMAKPFCMLFEQLHVQCLVQVTATPHQLDKCCKLHCTFNLLAALALCPYTKLNSLHHPFYLDITHEVMYNLSSSHFFILQMTESWPRPQEQA